ncbi:MAG: ATP-binding protein [Agitococcus sp.]|nr:ATP-binding protein [Agitococcus sp.]
MQIRFLINPMFFSCWYALAEPLVQWPEEVLTIQEAARHKKLSFERAVSLLGKIHFATPDSLDLSYARAILEGYAVHDWLSKHEVTFKSMLEKSSPSIERLMRAPAANPSGFGQTCQNIGDLAAALSLSSLEQQLLTFAVACSVSKQFCTLVAQAVTDSFDTTMHSWSRLLSCTDTELHAVLSAKAPLRLSNLLQAEQEFAALPAMATSLINSLLTGTDTLQERLLEEVPDRHGSGQLASLTEDDMTLATSVLMNSKQPGVNLLLYGANGLDKHRVLLDLAQRAKKRIFRLKDTGKNRRDLATLTYVAQKVLYQSLGHAAVLVIDHPGDVLARKPSEFVRMFMGVEVDNSYITPFDEMLLSDNPVACIWAGSKSDQLGDESIAHFVFHAPLQKAKKAERLAQLMSQATSLKLTKKTMDALMDLEGISALQLMTAKKAAKLSGATSKKEFEAALLQALRRSLRALHRDTSSKAKECVTQYSLDYLNNAGKFGPETILKSLRLRPRASLCLYGLPGTGKTQFVEHLANKLGKRLVAKRASDLLDKFVGESEQKIAQMFAQAEEEEAILFLDEGDSFLRDRATAQHSWEITRVNELLQHMERFEGIFIVATNLFKGLDLAALRRFTFKLEFLPLTPAQRWDMFLNETGLRERIGTIPQSQQDSWMDALVFMPKLTAGDFATIKYQCTLLGEQLSPSEWLDQLQIECSLKMSHASPLIS